MLSGCAQPREAADVVASASPTPAATASQGVACTPKDTAETFTLCLAVEGSGHISSINEEEFHCPPDCFETYERLDEPNTAPYWEAHVVVYPDDGAEFLGWTGPACENAKAHSCLLEMDRDRSITARFTDTGVEPSISIEKDGTGSGTVTSDPGGIDCGERCSAPFLRGSRVVLTAVPNEGSTFGGWSHAGRDPDCTPADRPECNVRITGAETVTATFN